MVFVTIPSLMQTITKVDIDFIHIFWEIFNWKIFYWLFENGAILSVFELKQCYLHLNWVEFEEELNGIPYHGRDFEPIDGLFVILTWIWNFMLCPHAGPMCSALLP